MSVIIKTCIQGRKKQITDDELIEALIQATVAIIGNGRIGDEIIFERKDLNNAGLSDYAINKRLANNKSKFEGINLEKIGRGKSTKYKLPVTRILREKIEQKLRPKYMQMIVEALKDDNYLEVSGLITHLPESDSKYFTYLLSKIIELSKKDIAKVIGIRKKDIMPTNDYGKFNGEYLTESRKKAFNDDFAGAIKELDFIECSPDSLYAITAEQELLKRAKEVQKEISAEQDSTNDLPEVLSNKIPVLPDDGHVTIISDLKGYEIDTILDYAARTSNIIAERLVYEGQPCIAIRKVRIDQTIDIKRTANAANEAYAKADYNTAISFYLILLENKAPHPEEIYKMLGFSYCAKCIKQDYADDSLEDIINKGRMYLNLAIGLKATNDTYLKRYLAYLETQSTTLARERRAQGQKVKGDKK